MINLGIRPVFHVHTYRCKHAENISDEQYVLKAISMNATDIWFTDHAPFPGNPFGNRMEFSQLPSYINDLLSLKDKYRNQIRIHIGLEIEYLPSFDQKGYYNDLLHMKGMELLLLGQHFTEIKPSQYSFSLTESEQYANEWKYCGEAVLQAIQTDYFKVIAHPDRIFRHCSELNDEQKALSESIISSANNHEIVLEQNLSSMRKEGYYRKEFWDIAKNYKTSTVRGSDAHCLKDLFPAW